MKHYILTWIRNAYRHTLPFTNQLCPILAAKQKPWCQKYSIQRVVYTWYKNTNIDIRKYKKSVTFLQQFQCIMLKEFMFTLRLLHQHTRAIYCHKQTWQRVSSLKCYKFNLQLLMMAIKTITVCQTPQPATGLNTGQWPQLCSRLVFEDVNPLAAIGR